MLALCCSLLLFYSSLEKETSLLAKTNWKIGLVRAGNTYFVKNFGHLKCLILIKTTSSVFQRKWEHTERLAYQQLSGCSIIGMLFKGFKTGPWNKYKNLKASGSHPPQTFRFKMMFHFSVSPVGAVSVVLNNLAFTWARSWLTSLSHPPGKGKGSGLANWN